jgi:hypothetical protein
MSTKIAVAVIHGVGKQDKHFADGMKSDLMKRFAEHLPGTVALPKEEIVIESVYWAPVLQTQEDFLWKKVQQDADLDFLAMRQLMIDFAADAIAYQPAPKERDVYDNIHEVVAKVLHGLAQKAGPDAPLAIIAHSLGTIIASNYFYDLQTSHYRPLSEKMKTVLGDTPTLLEEGKTFARFYTMGSPLAIWSLRYPNFGTPIQLTFRDKEWLNYFDEDDIIGYPLKNLNDEYEKAVARDVPINVGKWLSSWNPASHLGYWNDDDVTIPIAESLANLWKAVNV